MESDTRKLLTILKVVLFAGSGLFVMYNQIKKSSQDTTPKPIYGKAYVQLAIRGHIDTIYKYDRGYPVVSVGGRCISMAVPTGCSQYLQPHDSIVKEAGSKQLSSFRSYATYVQQIRWGSGDSANSSGFISARKLVKRTAK
jgi:hypothetical protein